MSDEKKAAEPKVDAKKMDDKKADAKPTEPAKTDGAKAEGAKTDPAPPVPTISKTILKCDRQLWQALYSPCGKFLVAGGYDGTIRRWDAAAEAMPELEPLRGHNGWVQKIAIVGDRLLSADTWGGLFCRDYADPTAKPHWHNAEAHPGWIRGLAVSPDSKLVATTSDKSVRVWSVVDGKLQFELNDHPERIYSAAFHPEGKSLVTGDLKGAIRQWDLATRKLTREIDASVLYRFDRIQQCGGVRQLSFNPSGDQLLASGQRDCGGGFATGKPVVLVLDWKTGKQTHELQLGTVDDGFVYDAQFHPDGYVMAVSSAFPGKGPTWFWRIGEEKPFFVPKGLTNGHSLSLHPDGKRIAMLIDVATNGNGRGKAGPYQGGSGKIQFLDFAA